MFIGISGHGNSIPNIIPQLKIEQMYIYFLALEVIIITRMHISTSSWEDVALEVTVSFVKSTDITYKTHSC